MIYLDNAATTRLCAEAREAFLRYAIEDFGNPSSAHRAGIAAERGLKAARETLSRALGCEPASIVLTSGGTEADALAVSGGARAGRWGELRRFQVGAEAVLLSPFARPSWLDRTRGLVVFFADHEREVMAIVRDKIR